jgi:hypothetical protein
LRMKALAASFKRYFKKWWSWLSKTSLWISELK